MAELLELLIPALLSACIAVTMAVLCEHCSEAFEKPIQSFEDFL